eukprot:7383545-Prymnesium_polylepis.1
MKSVPLKSTFRTCKSARPSSGGGLPAIRVIAFSNSSMSSNLHVGSARPCCITLTSARQQEHWSKKPHKFERSSHHKSTKRRPTALFRTKKPKLEKHHFGALVWSCSLGAIRCTPLRSALVRYCRKENVPTMTVSASE